MNEDGKVDEEDAQNIYDRAMQVLSKNLPAGSGFTAGAMMGWRGTFLKP